MFDETRFFRPGFFVVTELFSFAPLVFVSSLPDKVSTSAVGGLTGELLSGRDGKIANDECCR
jgi:hypothetical protein